MKTLKDIITEKLRLDKNVKGHQYTCHPKDYSELKSIIQERLKEDKDADLNDIDVRKITNMSSLFYKLDPHNIKIDKWDISNVTDMQYMFYNCKNFKGIGLENWDVSNVRFMSYMFYNCHTFNCDLSKWDVLNVKTTFDIFKNCNSLKKLPNWCKIA